MFKDDYVNEGVSENYLTPPKKELSKTGLPYSSASNFVLKQVLETRDNIENIFREIIQIDENIKEGLIGLDTSALSKLPNDLFEPEHILKVRIGAIQDEPETGQDHSVTWEVLVNNLNTSLNIPSLVSTDFFNASINDFITDDILSNELSLKANISDTYNQNVLDGLLNNKVNIGEVYSKLEIQNMFLAKADVEDVFTKNEITMLLADKADSSNSYSILEINDLLSSKVNTDSIYTQATIDFLLNQKADTNSVYSKTEVDAQFASYIDNAPEVLNTFNEIAAALGNDPNFATTISNQLASKADSASSLAGYGITDTYTKTELNILLQDTVSNLNLNSAAYVPASTFALAGHEHSLLDISGYGDIGGYIKSDGNSWVRSSGVPWSDLTSIPMEIKDISILLSNKANIDSPAFIGNVTSQTVPTSDESTKVATTAFVTNKINDLLPEPITKNYIDNLGIDAVTIEGRNVEYLLDYGNLTNIPVIENISNSDELTEGVNNLFHTETRVIDIINNTNIDAFRLEGKTLAEVTDYNILTNKPVINNFDPSSNITFTGLVDTSVLRVDGHHVWHSGNHGSNSGLHADLLDGVQLANIVHGSSPNRTMSLPTSDWNDPIPSGFFESPSAVNGLGSAWNWVLSFRHSSTNNNFGWQLSNPIGTNEFYFRGINNDTHFRWSKIWTDQNDGAGSGLDADLLDGLQGSSYIRQDSIQSLNMNDFNITNVRTLSGRDVSSRDKLRVWTDSRFAIGMGSSYTYGGLNDFAMTFQMSNHTTRGWWWGHESHSNAQGAASLTTTGIMTIAGSFTASGNITANSDIRLKTNITKLKNPLSIALKMEPVRFNWKDELLETARGSDFGFIAQWEEENLPELITEGSQHGFEDLKSLDYGKVSAIAIGAIKEQQKLIDNLNRRINELERKS